VRPRRAHRVVRALEVAAALVLALAFASAALGSHSFFAARKKRPKPYAISGTAGPKRPLFDMRDVAPGDFGTRTTTLRNAGLKPARILMQRTSVTRSPLDPYLQLSVYDATTKQCYYPVPKKPRPKNPKKGKKPRPTRSKPSGPCKGTAAWSKLPGKLTLLPKPAGSAIPKGAKAYLWKRKEAHRLQVKWVLAPEAPSSTAGQRSAFTLRWRAVKR
jgi:hypothetical protein